jgi:hypothetical protein
MREFLNLIQTLLSIRHHILCKLVHHPSISSILLSESCHETKLWNEIDLLLQILTHIMEEEWLLWVSYLNLVALKIVLLEGHGA